MKTKEQLSTEKTARQEKEHKLKNAVQIQKDQEEQKRRELQEQFERARQGNDVLTLSSLQLDQRIHQRMVLHVNVQAVEGHSKEILMSC